MTHSIILEKWISNESPSSTTTTTYVKWVQLVRTDV